MKRYIAVALILAMLLVAGMTSYAGSPFPDVPAYHWAYDAVKATAALGLYVGYPDGEFKGDDPLSRYESALVVARLLTVIDEKIKAELDKSGASRDSVEEVVKKLIVENNGPMDAAGLDAKYKEFRDSIANLENEFRSELDLIAPKLTALSSVAADNTAAIADLKDSVSALDRQVQAVNQSLNGLSDIVDNMKSRYDSVNSLQSNRINQLASDVERLAGQVSGAVSNAQSVGQLQDEVASLRDSGVNALSDRVDELQSKVDVAYVRDSERIKELSDALSEKAAIEDVASLKSSVDSLTAKYADEVPGLVSRMDQLESKVDVAQLRSNVKMTELSDAQAAASADIESLKGDLQELKSRYADDVTGLTDRVNELQSKVDVAYVRNAQRLKELSDALSQKASAEDLSAFSARVDELQSASEAAQARNTAEVSALRAELEELKARYDATSAAQSEAINGLVGRQDRTDKALEGLSGSVAQVNSALDAHSAELEDLRSQVASLKKDLDSTNNSMGLMALIGIVLAGMSIK